ncbi:hypothetical protein QYE76_022968 [Lolium multiflorum]|uniref:Uncharacterized protein n=1 Tax=Lolium multiflorum TaxID=4521 RepID=A0AAD8VTR7_LOLMU|nr:hypothetical protein QYE76_022968 [Lolium multiflorum]
MENYSLLMGAAAVMKMAVEMAAVMKMAVEMAAVSMEKPSGGTSPSRRRAGTETPVPQILASRWRRLGTFLVLWLIRIGVLVPISSEFSAIDSGFSSSDEEFSSPRFVDTKASGKLAKIFSDTSFESSADSVISSDSDSVDNFNFIDKSAAIGKVFTNLYDGVTNPDKNQYSKYHQIYAIEETNRAQPETSEDFDDLGNPYVDPSDLRRGLGTKYVGSSPRERVQLPQAAWDRAARAMDGSEPMNTTATAEELQAYQYRLARVSRELEKQTASLKEERGSLRIKQASSRAQSTIRNFGR